MADEDRRDAFYQQVRSLGRSAFGEAVLYRRVEDDSLVVWKEMDLSRATEKELCQVKQEVALFALIDHPNVISFYNDYIDGQTLLIEMEYANGGTLQEKIRCRTSLFSEEVIWWYFFQIASAVEHIHQQGVIHRDIMPTNIFLTKSGLCKLGDFGFGLIMEERKDMAISNVRTYSYMAPELHLGWPYNQKTDIWSLGCVLFELCELDVPFRGSNPANLAQKTVEFKVPDIHQQYTNDLQMLIKQLLAKDPDDRPTMEDVLETSIVKATRADMESKIAQLDGANRKIDIFALESSSKSPQPVTTSVTSEVCCWGGGRQTPVILDEFVHGTVAVKVSAGYSHFAAITAEKELYTWTSSPGGVGMFGQLGHGDKASYCSPKLVTALDGIPVRHAVCGEDFTVCLTEEGEVYACGSDYWGCLGQGHPVEQEKSYTVPVPVLLPGNLHIEQLSCGDTHVMALTKSKEVFSWGCGKFGRLGIGSEMNVSTPQKVQLPGQSPVVSLSCAGRGSLLLTANGRLLACGDNQLNQLGLNVSLRLRASEAKGTQLVSYKSLPSQVKALSRYQISSVACGSRHSAVIDDAGHLITFGSNKHGQLGTGDIKKHSLPHVVEGPLLDKTITMVACGDDFTIAATSDKTLYSWGLGDSGQLGAPLPAGKKAISMPRPVFESLYSIQELSCKHWHTILIRERVMSINENSTSHVSSLNGENLSVTQKEPDSERQSQADSSSRPTSLPAWLQQEWEDAIAGQCSHQLSQSRPELPTVSKVRDTGTETLLSVRQTAPRGRSLDAGRPTVQHHKSNELGVAPIAISSSMDRLDVLKRTTASATLMKSSSGDIVISGRRNHHGVAEEDKSAHQSLKEPDKCHKLDMKPNVASSSSSGGLTMKQVGQHKEDVTSKENQTTAELSRTFSMSVADHKYVMEEIQSLAEQIQLDLENPGFESGETPSESNTEVPGKREGLPEHDYDHLLLQELRRLKAYNEKLKDTVEKQRQCIVMLEEENKIRIQVENEMWRLVSSWTSDCKAVFDSPNVSVQ